jgi:hypothetical protein
MSKKRKNEPLYSVGTFDGELDSYTPQDGLTLPCINIPLSTLREVLRQLREMTYSCRRRRGPGGDYDDNDSSVMVERTDGGMPDDILVTGHHLRRLSTRDRTTMKRRIADAKADRRFRAANAARAARERLAAFKQTTKVKRCKPTGRRQGRSRCEETSREESSRRYEATKCEA